MTEQQRWTNWEDVPLALSAQDTADLLGVHVNTVKHMIHDGRLPAVKVGRAWRVKRETVKALLDAEGSQSDAKAD